MHAAYMVPTCLAKPKASTQAQTSMRWQQDLGPLVLKHEVPVLAHLLTLCQALRQVIYCLQVANVAAFSIPSPSPNSAPQRPTAPHSAPQRPTAPHCARRATNGCVGTGLTWLRLTLLQLPQLLRALCILHCCLNSLQCVCIACPRCVAHTVQGAWTVLPTCWKCRPSTCHALPSKPLQEASFAHPTCCLRLQLLAVSTQLMLQLLHRMRRASDGSSQPWTVSGHSGHSQHVPPDWTVRTLQGAQIDLRAQYARPHWPQEANKQAASTIACASCFVARFYPAWSILTCCFHVWLYEQIGDACCLSQLLAYSCSARLNRCKSSAAVVQLALKILRTACMLPTWSQPA